ARPPRPARAGSGPRTPTRRPGSAPRGAGTARRGGARAAPWRSRGRPGEGDAVEGEVPGGEPRILPFVRHGQDAHRVEVAPVGVADLPARGRGRPLRVVALQPEVHVKDVDLLGPEKVGEGLPLHQLLVLARGLGLNGFVVLV